MARPKRSAPTFGERGVELHLAGYVVVPLRPGTKVPIVKDWWRRRTLEEVQELARQHPNAGIGLACGHDLGDGTMLVVLDVDVLDKNLVKNLLALFPKARLVRAGRAPRVAVWMRVPIGTPCGTSAKYGADRHHVALLGPGRQVVAFGVHPDTHQPYRWRDVDPLDVPALDVEFEAADVLQRAAETLHSYAELAGWEQVEAAAFAGPAQESTAALDMAPPVELDRAQIVELLNLFKSENVERTTWRNAGMAVHHQFGGSPEGLDVWIEWSRGAPNFGGCEEQWATFKDERPGRVITLRSYLKRAQVEFGWRPPRDPVAAPAVQATTLQPIDLAGAAWGALEGPRWVLADWLPRGACTLLAGDGGSGKSYVSELVAVQLASGTGQFAADRPLRVMYYSAEDPAEVLLWRLERLSASLSIDPASLDGNLFLYDATTVDNVMFSDAYSPAERLTARYHWLAAEAKRLQVDVVILDNVSDLYDANEVDRARVRQFVTAMGRIARDCDAGVVLLAHLDKAGAQQGGDALGYSGSTAWNNSVRSRWFLYRDGDRRVLALRKSNWAQAEHQVTVTWSQEFGTFVLGVMQTAAIGEAEIRTIVWNRLEEILRAGEVVSVAESSNRSAGVLLERTAGWPRSIGRRAILDLVRQFGAEGLLVQVEYQGANRQRKVKWMLPDAPVDNL